MNIPNILSLVRIILTPLFIILLFADFKMAKVFALLVFAIAAITDAYDGHLARKYNQITPEGKFLDPLADKILVLSAFISFAFINIIDFWMVGLIIFRDLFVTGLRFIMSSRGFEFVTSKLSKYKTAFQLTIIILTLIFISIEGLDINIFIPTIVIIKEYKIIYILTAFTAIFTAYTGILYVYANRFIIQKFLNGNQ
ncbi:MAG: CDP-diacylglycerol--glycerol-3-phosphate 3-phosphatidyltransferase [Candidatus Marinimicrobia bacterium]|mgnify:FL=1|jgi:CDP-diacylglycerol--glycerol-3-phosphate 3-phosphatidyltransferase|nr:CDP-diacylglycerol--glycerol-3-phosphate 3-phosphatidyltransferase [Candidatus Neomarinimicrobiota bacterium]|tara:strand:+ start:1003 stop:1593 length:591 start_codon:yes stop_codon:yes gene_type:complete